VPSAECAVTIDRIAAGGAGVGRLPDGRVIFVPRTAPGDRALVTITRREARFARGRLERLETPGPDRVAPGCHHYVDDECGGCQLMHMGAEAQARALRGVVGDALRRIARIEVDDPEFELAPDRWEYRTRISLTPGKRGALGFHRVHRPSEVFPLTQCPIAAPAVNALWRRLRDARRLLPRELARLTIRLDRGGGEHVVVEAEPGPVWQKAGELHRIVAGAAPLTIWWRPSGGAARALAGSPSPFPATVFEQVNPVMGDRVRRHAVRSLGPVAGARVWDLYAGIGDTTRLLIDLDARVESVEIDRRAVELAAGDQPEEPRVVRHQGAVEDLVESLGTPDRVITNPPREGMDRRVTGALLERGPERIVYVSCDPATLARDLTRLTAGVAPGARYRLAGLVAFDLFPQTAHVETVAVLERS